MFTATEKLRSVANDYQKWLNEWGDGGLPAIHATAEAWHTLEGLQSLALECAQDALQRYDELEAQLIEVHALLRAWRATVDIDRNSKGDDPVIMHNGRNNSAREINAAGVALAEYVDSLEAAE